MDAKEFYELFKNALDSAGLDWRDMGQATVEVENDCFVLKTKKGPITVRVEIEIKSTVAKPKYCGAEETAKDQGYP